MVAVVGVDSRNDGGAMKAGREDEGASAGGTDVGNDVGAITGGGRGGGGYEHTTKAMTERWWTGRRWDESHAGTSLTAVEGRNMYRRRFTYQVY